MKIPSRMTSSPKCGRARIIRLEAGAARNTEPDFRDRPDGKIFEDDQADWTYVKDVARGIQQVHMAPKLAHRVYNLASGRASSNRDTFEAVRKAAHSARCSALKPGRRPAGRPSPATDLTRAAEMGYKPEHTLETDIAPVILEPSRSDGFRLLGVGQDGVVPEVLHIVPQHSKCKSS